MFNKIVHASDGSEHAFHALTFALAIAQQNKSELHMVCVQEIPYMPEFIEEVREATGSVAHRIRGVFRHARAMAEEFQVEIHTHAIAGHPVRDVVIGRVNWTFAGSDAGGRRAAAVYTLIETCLCRARHKHVYAARRTMPSGSGRKLSFARTNGVPRGQRLSSIRHSLASYSASRKASRRSFG